jgi:aminoglycoside 6-adenylyltransferase
MDIKQTEQEVLSKLTKWGEVREDVRAMILTSSRANPDSHLDIFSDYDIILVVKDVHPYLSDSWLEDFGKVLVVYHDPIQLESGFAHFTRVTHYQDGTKIDYAVWPAGLLQWIADEPTLPAYLDDGYRVLLDKDSWTEKMKPPTFKAYIPVPPSEQDFQYTISEFFNDSIYVAKNLRRDDLFPVKLCFDNIMKQQSIRTMLEWRMEIDHGWSVKPGAHGKGLKKYVAPETWARLESTYVGVGTEENWQALFDTISLFRDIAKEVGTALGYAYPQDTDNRVMRHLHRIHDMF